MQICFLMHASAECAEASLLSAINKITEAARAAARLVFDDPSRTGDGSKCPVMQLVNHTHTARNPRLFCIRGCVGNCVEDQRGPSVRPSVLPYSFLGPDRAICKASSASSQLGSTTKAAGAQSSDLEKTWARCCRHRASPALTSPPRPLLAGRQMLLISPASRNPSFSPDSCNSFPGRETAPIGRKNAINFIPLAQQSSGVLLSGGSGGKTMGTCAALPPERGVAAHRARCRPAQGCHCPSATEATELPELGAETRTLAGVLGRAGEKENVCN